MTISTHFTSPAEWALTHFGGVSLGDLRRTRRVQTLVAGWARQPGATIPQLSGTQPYASKAAYSLLSLPTATPDALQAPHRQLVQSALQAEGTYLLIEDTTELSWPEAPVRREGLGPVGRGKARSQGVLLHSLVAACWCDGPAQAATKRPALALLGLCDQQFHVRQPVPAAEKASPGSASRLRQQRGTPLESALWTHSLRALGTAPPQARWVVVADRGADVYEHLQQCHQQGLGFVVRAAQDRVLVKAATDQSTERLFATARAVASSGEFVLSLRGRPQQPARDVVLHVSYTPLLALRAPQRPGGAPGKGAPVPCAVVRVWEPVSAEADAPGLEWLLLCDRPVTSFAQAHECARQYASRWLIEDFHKALKTGLGAEKLQLQTAERLFAAVSLLSVVALALVDLREKSRIQPDEPAEAAGLETTALRVLKHYSRRPVCTVRDVYYALAGLGGHLGRTGDGPPGWLTLWRGLMTLRLLVEGVNLANQLKID